MESIFETRGREQKALAIAHTVEEMSGSSVDVEQLTEAGWLKLAQLAGYKRKTPPSAETRRIVIEMLRSRENNS